MKSKIGKIVMLFSLVLSMAITMFAVEIKAADTSNANAIDNCVTRKFLPYDAETAATYLSGENTYPKLEGHVFAGWYTDDVCSKENLLNDKEPSGTVYALFVPEHVLSVQAQVSAHIVDNSVTTADETASIRFVTTVDSLNYQKVGFEVSYTDGNGSVKTATSASTKVYDKLYITGTTANKDNIWQVTPAESFCGLSKYFKACTVTNVPSDDYTIKFTVRPFWITMDGAKVYGVTATKTVEDGCLRDDVYVSDSGEDTPYHGTADKPYGTLAYAIQHVNDNKRVHIADTYTIASDANWPSHEKKVTVTGGTLDFSAKSRIYIKGDVTFTDMNLTLSNTTNTAIFAEGHKLVVKEGVNFTNEAAVKNGTVRVEIVGGGSTQDVASTNMKLYAGSYNIIYGGAIDHKVTGDTNVVVGKKVNPSAKYTDHDSTYLLFGGSCEATVSGNTNVTVEDGATFNYVYGGGYLKNSNVEGATNITFSGSAMSIYGGSYAGTNSDTNVVMNGGIAEQVLGGSAVASMTGNTNVQILGGTVTRRVYGGCYNELSDLGQWADTNYQVTGHTNVSISPKATLSLNHSDMDNSIYAISRSSDAYDNEWGTFIFNQASYDGVYNTKLGYNDNIYASKFSALTHHYLVTTNGNNADDLYGNVSPEGEWLHIQPKDGYVATVTIDNVTKYFTEGEGYYPLPELTSKTSQTNIEVTFSEKVSTAPVVGDTEVAIIKIADCENGTVTSSKEYCVVNETDAITLTVTPDEGYNLTELSVKKDGEVVTLDKEIASNGGEYSFIPEAGTYTVEATFTAKEYGAIGGTISGAASGTITATNTTTGEVYTFSDALYEDGSYGISVPVGTYQLSVDGGAKIGAVAGVTVTKDQVTVQNIVLKNKMRAYFNLTSEGYYKSTQKEGHNYFVDGWGSQWVAELTLPELSNGNIAGFTLHKRATGVTWYKNWLRIGVKNVNGAYKLYVKMNVDGDTTLQAEKTYSISDTSVKGKTFQVLLLDGELIASLDGKVIQKFTSSTTFADGKGNLGAVLGTFGTGEIYCGLFAGYVGTVIEDWSFDKITSPTEKHTVSGNVSTSVEKASNLTDITITFANKTYAVKTYTTTVNQDGSYSIGVPSGDYKVTASYKTGTKYYENNTFECSVSGDVTKDISLRKNAIYENSAKKYFEVTPEGYLKSLQLTHPLFQSASGTQWVADMELPDLVKNEEVGFVLVKKNSNGIGSTNWLRILIKKVDGGKIQLFTQLNIDGSFNEATSIDLDTTSTEGKVLQVALMNKKIFVSLDDEILAEYDSNTTMIDGSTHTVEETFGTLGTAQIYCGLRVSKDKVIKDWNFSNVLDTSKEYTVSGTVSAGLSVADVSSAKITFVNNEDATKSYTVKPNTEGNYSVKMPSGDYKVTVSGSAHYENNTYDCSVLFRNVTQDFTLRKNVVINKSYFEVTSEGYYKALQKQPALFYQAAGKAWVADMELPNLTQNEEAGFVLIQKNNGGAIWGRWMRILVKKADDGKLKLFTQMRVDAELNGGTLIDEATQIDISATSVEGKKLQVALVSDKIYVSLEDNVIAEYDSSTTMKAGSTNNVETIFGKLGTYELYCGLYVQKDKIIKDWNFSNVLDTTQTHTVSGKVSASLASANVADARITFVNKADVNKTYTTQPNAEGNYSIQVPTGDYKVTVSYDKYYVDHTLECNVAFCNITKDISLRKNKVSNEGTSFEVTADGNYQSIPNDYKHNIFMDGYGSAWVASLELPDIADGKGVGFVLHKRENNAHTWGKWMRIVVKKTSGEAIELYTQMHVDGSFDEATTVYPAEIYAKGKTLQVALMNGNIVVTLDGTVIATYDSSSKLTANSNNTVGAVFGDLSAVYCGLLADTSGIVIKDWNFSNVLDASKEYTVSGTVSSGLEVANVSEATLTFANKADESKVYTVRPNAQGKYSVQVPSGEYKVTLSYAAYYVDNIFDCRVVHSDVTQDFSLRKNKVSGEASQFNVTTEGYYQSIPSDYTHNTFQMGFGSRWVASLELPDVQAGQGVGFVLCKRENSYQPKKWMRILVKKASNGTIDLYTQMHLDAEVNNGTIYDEATTVSVEETYAAGKTLQVSLVNGKITVTLDGVVLVQYDENTKLEDSHMGIVGDVFGDLSVINCGLLAYKPGITIQDWNFSNVSNAGNDSSLMAALGGKTLSVLGDSISTWGGVSNNTAYNTTIGTNNPYYNGSNMTALTALNQTYWGSVMEKYHMSLCVNNSFSSGRLVDDWIATSNGVHIPSALTRCTELGNKNGITPDVIAIYIGTNDFKTPKTEGVYTSAKDFGIAYQTMLDSIATQYSGAKVFCFTLIPNNQRTDQTEWNAYNEQIRTVVANYDCAVLVDIAQNSGIDWNNYTNYTVDGVHPNLAGMKKIADVFENALYATYVQ